MSRLRAILDRINDVEATISRIEAEATAESSFAYRMSLRSLENRRDMLREELANATTQEFVEICDYRLVPEGGNDSYAIAAVTSALQDFQDLVTFVFDAITSGPKKRATRDLEAIEKTRFNFGFAYSGSLGVALTMKKDRELFDTDLERAIEAVFEIADATSEDHIKNAAALYGLPTVRKLYGWSKTHRDFGLSADIKWVRDNETRHSVLTQPQEFAEICRIIEARSDEDIEVLTANGRLVSWDAVHRRFILDVPESELINGTISKDFDVTQPRIVQARYEVDLVKHTLTEYATDRDVVTWELTDLRDLG